MRLAATPYTRPAPTIGALKSHVAGRTDHLPIDVPAESFVIPADVVSGLGEGNSENGHKVLDHLFNLPGASAPAAIHRKDGGSVPIMAAGGEYVVPPEVIARIGSGDLKRGHKILEHFVKHTRKQTIKTLKKLPTPHR
jgi:hypothetical protein